MVLDGFGWYRMVRDGTGWCWMVSHGHKGKIVTGAKLTEAPAGVTTPRREAGYIYFIFIIKTINIIYNIFIFISSRGPGEALSPERGAV
jgi:hypothetical protein